MVAAAAGGTRPPSYISLPQAVVGGQSIHVDTNTGSPYTGPNSAGSSQLVASSVLASPLATAKDAPWPGDGSRDPHLSGTGPRYFPGVVTRGQRRNSVRQGSAHESDEGSNRLKKTATREGPEEGKAANKG